MTRKMRTTIEILTPHAQHYDYFLQKLLSILFEAWQGMRESPFLWWAFFLHDCKEPDMVGLIHGNSHGVS